MYVGQNYNGHRVISNFSLTCDGQKNICILNCSLLLLNPVKFED